ncbi:MAG: TonB-dependent receptor [Mediterranea sp.]|jgi:iron complex outermembrane receptor protein|nr:TonB-dependent receptor [Mediterranea sp.]
MMKAGRTYKLLAIAALLALSLPPHIARANNESASAINKTDDFTAAVREAVERQLLTHPKSTLKDLYKFFFQDRYGPGHLITDTAAASRYLRQELAVTPTEGYGQPVEAIGWQNNYYRVHLGVVKRGMVPYDLFLRAFVGSANQAPLTPVPQWREEWRRIEAIVHHLRPTLPQYSQDSLEIESRLAEGQYASHHSAAYNEAYRPHYRIIAKEIFDRELRPLLREGDDEATAPLDGQDIGEVVVTGTRYPIAREMTPNPVSVVSRQQIEQSDATSLLPALVEQVPSLFVTSRGMAGYGVSTGAAGDINLRGFSGGAGRVLILVDGHPQYATIYGHPVADAYIASDAARVEVSRGAASVLYGSNAMGGTINIITRHANADGNKLGARLMGGSYGTRRYSLTDSYRKERLNATVSANYERSDGHRANAAFETMSGYARLGYILSRRWRLAANVNVAKANSQNPGAIADPLLDARAWVLRGMSALSIENSYERSVGAVNLFYNWGNHKIDDGYRPGGEPRPHLFRSTDYMAGINAYQSVRTWTGNRLTAGLDAKLYGGNAYRDPVTEVYADHKQLNEVAAYLFTRQSLGRWSLNAGIRLEHHNLYGLEWVPGAGISFQAARQTFVKLSVSKGFRTPNMRELYMYASANADLLPESSVSYDLSLSQRLLDGRLAMELNLYYTQGDNIVQAVMVDGRPQNQNVGSFANKGIELSANYRIAPRLTANANYSYLYMGTPLTGAPGNKFYAGATYSPGRFALSLYTQVVGRLYLTTGQDARRSNYTLLNARVTYRAASWLTLIARGDNLLCQTYETMNGYTMPRTTVMCGASVEL